ncbi:MAG: hypothetical protein A3G33_05260 [Omnitrophica bacterium RIFCSPLOWO2_12_FULL_44_17]|uniref:Phosphoribulokinase/uridine kinase domain-containing protein n=1 Tax=Candidatus Danuiimicrobium aquiferis TaxID=1801832 RepID=A0A1G1KQ48_9BACT|nr:MAG: hypothetical protein A3B72_04965 [Omnitrophica bacterium RIFCSPHIGHO2_02_FULL_45_28]OGW92382.1 MAG: hypothetical protein A3E74_08720 [Omnitrophica bacterium RIFCSPHIGHO2_12_FULL_44_12]OGW95043.1 MAG: hypothetical protein A3G33_05260 [Omnitrophica bacterium RIFCSPLOWO2_12_FULL_44_17]OGX02964.1 MAG: hypothetical protein A3J12_01480 [Omnitrophica bacterium RIFCSPLOWO2_02_FULL_44_11]
MNALNSANLLYDFVESERLKHIDERMLVLIGGCSRSGKSTVALKLSKKFSDRNIPSQIINLDAWLISIEKRKDNSTVLERYDCEAIEKSVEDLLKGFTIMPPVYDFRTRRRVSETGGNPITLSSGILIAEGVVALALENLCKRASIKIFVDISDIVRLKRLMDFYYESKFLSYNESKTIINEREAEEVPFVKSTAKYADLIGRFAEEGVYGILETVL